MGETVGSPARVAMYETLRNIALGVKNLGVHEFDLQQLKSLNIRVEKMKLHSASPHQPSYFAPYQNPSMEVPEDDELDGPYKGIDDESETFTRPINRAYGIHIHLDRWISCNDDHHRDSWTSKCIGDYPFNGLYRDEQPEFGCYALTDSKDRTKPHVKVIMYNNMVTTESAFLDGEILPIIRIMLTQFRRERFSHQMVAPVLIVSLMGFKARVIESYFQDGSLVLNSTKLYDFTHANNAAFKKLCRWYLSDAIGDTAKTP